MPAEDQIKSFGGRVPHELDPYASVAAEGEAARDRRPGQTAGDALVGSVLAERYLILSVIGQGGMGVVYEARHELIDRLVAIKMLKPSLVADEQSVKRFQHEARAASRLNHPHVITIYDFGITASGEPYIVMEYLEGISLADVIQSNGYVPPGHAVPIFAQVCEALEHAHQQKMIHRDLKPGNIMLLSRGQGAPFVKVVDFGIAKAIHGAPAESQRLTQTGEIFGSPVYMSPEQCAGGELDTRSDIYSMGIVMYETLTGRLPFAGSTLVETITMQISSPPPSFARTRPDLQISAEVEAIVMRALRKDPALRYASMEEMRLHLLSVLRNLGAPPGKTEAAPPAPLGRPPAEFTRSRPVATTEFNPGHLSRPGTRSTGEPGAGHARRATSEFRRLQPQPSPPVDEQRSAAIAILSGAVVLLVVATTAIIWAAASGFFSGGKQAPARPPAKRQEAQQGPDTAAASRAQAPATGVRAAAGPSAHKTADAPARHQRAEHRRPRLRHAAESQSRGDAGGSPSVAPAAAGSTTSPPRQHFKGDDYGRWEEFKDMEQPN